MLARQNPTIGSSDNISYEYLNFQVSSLILKVDPALPTTIKHVRQYKARKVVYDVEMTTAGASQAIRDAFGLFWRKTSGRRLPPELKGISFTNATSFPTRVRLRLLKELCRHHQVANPQLSCFITSYLPRPELKIRDRRGLVTSLTYTQAVQQLPHHLTIPFLQDLYNYAKTNLPEKEVIERFLILTPDLLLGTPPEQLSMSTDDSPAHQGDSTPFASTQQAPVVVSTAQSLPSSSHFTSFPPPPYQPSLIGSFAQNSQLNTALLDSQASQPSAVTYASLASLPPTSGAPVAMFVGTSAPPTPTPAPAQVTAHTQQTTTSPTYAVLTPVQFSPTDASSGSFLTSAISSGMETVSNNDSLDKRNRQRFTQKSTPYPPQ